MPSPIIYTAQNFICQEGKEIYFQLSQSQYSFSSYGIGVFRPPASMQIDGVSVCMVMKREIRVGDGGEW